MKNNSYILRLKSSSLISNTFKLSSSNVLVYLAVFILTPVISRLYSPELYGDWGVFSNVILTLNCVIFLSYNNALIQTTDNKEVPALILLCLICSVILTIFVTGSFYIGKWFGIEYFAAFPGLKFLALASFLSAIYLLLTALSNRYSLYNIIAIVAIFYGLAQPLLRILFGVVWLNQDSLIYAYLISTFLAILIYLFPVGHRIPSFLHATLKDIKLLTVKYKKYPLFDAPAAIIETLCTTIVLLILAGFFKKEEIGCYTMVMQLIILPISVVGGSLSTVFFRELSISIDDDIKMKALVVKTTKIAFLLSFIPILFFSFGGDYLLSFFLGEKWTNASQMVLCMSLFSVPIILSEPLLPIFKACNKQEIRFKFDIANIIFTLVALFISIFLFDNILLVLLVYSMVVAIMRFTLFHIQIKQVSVFAFDISKHFYTLIVACYVILGMRIMYIFI